MKVTYNWLKELVDITSPVEEVASALSSAGLEVESIEKRSIPENTVVAYILSIEKHPNADHLSLCMVDAGENYPVPVVCGAPNVAKGMKSALAKVGCALSPDFTVKEMKIRGQRSMGMLCSERELGISDNHEGIICLPDNYKTGAPLSDYIKDDSVIEIDLTPNRGDCLSVLGIAREVSSQFNIPVKNIALKPEESGDSIDNHIKVIVEDPTACPRYMGRLIKGVTIKESPQWLKQRLLALDIRPISNVVDITNYILLLFGQPMHSFDYAKIAGKKIIVKKAKDDQKFVTLDEIERTLISEDLLICDSERPTALAGIMGGAESGISEDTKDVFLECAYFDPVGIRKTSKRLDLSTESSFRFERGVDPETGLVDALDTAAKLIHELAGGHVVKGVIDIYPKAPVKKTIPLRISQVSRLLGVSIVKENIIKSLSSLGIKLLSENNKEKLLFESPLYRHDLEYEVDLIEEVGRLYGYDNIPAAPDATIDINQKTGYYEKIINTIRKTLASLGLNETVTYSMTSEENCLLLTPGIKPVKISNPLSPQLSRMRTTLLGNLLEVASYNINRKNINNSLFEIGRIFTSLDEGKQPIEKDIVAILMEGAFLAASWNNKKQEMNFYILKAIIESLRTNLRIPDFSYTPIKNHNFFNTESAEISGKDIKGTLGKIRDNILKKFDIKTPVYYAELDITELLKHGITQPLYSELPRYPAVERDFCFIMDENLCSSTISDEIYSISNLVESVAPFDVYRGAPLEKGLKSLAFSVILRAKDRTLTDKDAEKIGEKIISNMKSKYNVVLRK